MTCLTAFHPYVHAWHFVNDFTLTAEDGGATQLLLLRTTGGGLAGGMVTVALDRYHDGMAVSRQRELPARDSALHNEFIRRQLDLVNHNDLVEKFLEWSAKPDEPSIIAHSIGYATKREWWEKIQPRLTAGMVVPLGIVGYAGMRTVCLAYGYELIVGGHVSIFVYDPATTGFTSHSGEWGGRTSRDRLSFDVEAAESQIAAGLGVTPIRGFFAMEHPGPSILGRVGQLQPIQSEYLGMDACLQYESVHRRDRIRLTLSLSANVIPYYYVLLSRHASPQEFDYLVDAESGECMSPHACEMVASPQVVEFGLRQMGSFLPQAVPPVYLAVTLPGERQEAVIHLPQPAIRLACYLHAGTMPTQELPNDLPDDACQEDVVVVEADVAEDIVLAMHSRRLPVAVPADPVQGVDHPVLAGFEHRFHLGYVKVPIYARAWMEWMVPPVTLRKEGVAVAEESWGNMLLCSGYTLDQYTADLHWSLPFRAVDAAAIQCSRLGTWYARLLLDFVKPVYAGLANLTDFVWVRERVHEYFDREMLKEMIGELSGGDRAWAETHGGLLRTAVRAELAAAIAATPKMPGLGARLGDLTRTCLALRRRFESEAVFAPPSGSGGDPSADAERRLMQEYRDLVGRAVAEAIAKSWRRQAVLAGVVRRLRRRVPKSAVR